MAGRILFNGKFYSAQMTGVHRVAEELLHALDDLIADGEVKLPQDAVILAPSNAKRQPGLNKIPSGRLGRLPWIWWEQIELPWLARGNYLVNLCNLGPLANRGGLTMIHDAQVYITPESYSRAFVAWYRLALPTLGRRAGEILTVSEYSKRMLVQHGVARPEKIRVIPNGVDHIQRSTPDFAAVERLGLAPHGYVLALSSTHSHKNIGLLFDAVAKTPNLKLVLIGAADTQAFASEGKTPPANVVFAGRVSDNEMRGLMERALCFACPSLTEGFGLPPLEAMLLGCPAIISPCGALPEVCDDAAMRVDPYDPDAWAGAFEKLSTDAAFREALSAAGIARASQFTWRKSAKLLAEAISGDLANKS